MDESGIEAAGLKPLEDEFRRIAKMKNLKNLRDEVLRLQGYGVEALFNLDSTQDFKDSTQVIGEVDQGGLGLPDRDYYTKDDEKSKQTRDEYLKHVAKMFELMGDDAAQAAANAQTVMSIETRLAKASLTKVERRDPQNVYHRMSVAEVKKLAPDYPWDGYLRGAGLTLQGDSNVATPEFFKEATPHAQERADARLADLSALAPDQRFRSAPGQEVRGRGFQLQRTNPAGDERNPAALEALREPDERRTGRGARAGLCEEILQARGEGAGLELVHNLEAALREDIQGLPWMSDETKKQALVKLDAFANKIGYPGQVARLLGAGSRPRLLRGQRLPRRSAFEFNRQLAKIGKPVDRAEWVMPPPTVNAYYNPQLNEIVFPAGILQPPFFDAQRRRCRELRRHRRRSSATR